MPKKKQRLIVISGLSGAGKTVALHTLEDSGFYCIDNLPLGLLHEFGNQLSSLGNNQVEEISICIDARNPEHLISNLPESIALLKQKNLSIELIYIETGLRKSHHNPILDNEGEQVANVNELIKSAAEYDAENAEASLENYLHEIALVADTDNFDATSGAISLMTMHAAKGLEFPCVLIVGLEEGLIPHARSQYSDDELEEERRLLFVGITRAKERLTLSYARNRTLHGSSNATVRSQFIRELTSLDVPKKEPAIFVQKSKHADAFPNMINIESTLPKKETVDFSKGEIVRHAMLGLGRIEKVIPARENAKVIVKFNTGATKTLIVKSITSPHAVNPTF